MDAATAAGAQRAVVGEVALGARRPTTRSLREEGQICLWRRRSGVLGHAAKVEAALAASKIITEEPFHCVVMSMLGALAYLPPNNSRAY